MPGRHSGVGSPTQTSVGAGLPGSALRLPNLRERPVAVPTGGTCPHCHEVGVTPQGVAVKHREPPPCDPGSPPPCSWAAVTTADTKPQAECRRWPCTAVGRGRDGKPRRATVQPAALPRQGPGSHRPTHRSKVLFGAQTIPTLPFSKLPSNPGTHLSARPQSPFSVCSKDKHGPPEAPKRLWMVSG